ncbi:NADH-quinone oxidoreductase subunit M [Poriferisphaera corsica]|uniref:NADH-quinone oxidoreductase subunit M n=1 Tax=Poriferisphaera corsica TaxID=2528020 RepID=A0A517YV86_9BACT|nr:NADH-quinone oxidoreductase subunit M [Poriferisphaera corsica]QDU34127.1 NADH-quinone oxidoreductase subunit M [Poriferisphaera corsica]
MTIDQLLIPVMIIAPAIFAFALLMPGNVFDFKKNIVAFSLIGTLVSFVASLVLAYNFNWAPENPAMQFVDQIPWVPGFGLTFSWGIDSISLWLILLSTFLMPLIILGSYSAFQGREREFFFWMLILETAMLGTFVATDIIFFYICFEFTLIPLFFLIGIFGGSDRLRAARIFFLYTFTGSMLTFAAILYVAWNYSLTHNGAWTFNIAELYTAAQALPLQQQGLVLAGLLAGFAVKVPLFPVHTWLPLAHTEAPTAGSVILAGVLLKLGTYGILRFAIPMTPQAVIVFAPWIGALAVAGVLYAALVCWVQTDVKKLVAYSSVSHLGFCVLGLFAFDLDQLGSVGSVMYMVNHGLSTGALFLCIGMIYERFHTREMAKMSGLGRAMPVWSFFMVFFVASSVGLPGLNGFIGEFLTLIGSFTSPETLGWRFAAPAAAGMIFAAIYLLYMTGKVVWGPLKIPHVHGEPAGQKPKDLTAREIIVLTPIAIVCVWLGFNPNPMLKSLEAPIAKLSKPTIDLIESRKDTDEVKHAGTTTHPAPPILTTQPQAKAWESQTLISN